MRGKLWKLALAICLATAAPGIWAQPVCEDISDQCLTTDLLDCVDAVGESVQVQVGGPGAEDNDGTGGTCGGLPTTALVTFTKSAADELEVTVENTSCDDSSLTAVFFNISTAVSSMMKGTPWTNPDPTITTWSLDYSQTTSTNDGFGTKAGGFGHFDAAIYNGDDPSPTGGDPKELLSGGTIVFTIDIGGTYDLCDLLTEISTPTPGDRNRSTVVKFQSCGMQGASAFIGPCTGDDQLLAVVSDFTLTPGDGEMTVDWSTSLEIDNAGFNVLRRDKRGGGWSDVNAEFIAGAGDSVTGASYRFVDRSAFNGVDYEYRIEDIDFHGVNDLSAIHDRIVNPSDPDVRLVSPAYGATVALERGLELQYHSVRVLHGAGYVQVSADPSFEAHSVILAPVALRAGERSTPISAHTLSLMESAAATSGGVLYWRVTDRSGKTISDTFRMEIQ